MSGSILDRIVGQAEKSPTLLREASAELVEEQVSKQPEGLLTGAASDSVKEKPESDLDAVGTVVTEAKSAEGSDVGMQASPVDIVEEVKGTVAVNDEIIKVASGLLQMADAISAMPTEDFDFAVNKEASADNLDAAQYLSKLAYAGDPLAQHFLDHVAVLQKIATDAAALEAQGIDPEQAVQMAAEAEAMGDAEGLMAAQGAELEAQAEQAAEQLAVEIVAENPEMSPEEAKAIADQAVAETITGLMQGGVEESADESMLMDEAVGSLAEAIIEADPGIEPEEAIEVATETVEALIVDAEGEMSKQASGEEESALVDEAVGSLAEAIIEADPGIDPEEAIEAATETVEALIVDAEAEAAEGDEMVAAVAEDIAATNPDITPADAVAEADAALEDATEVLGVQAGAGEVDENGNYVMSDEELAKQASALIKTASANVYRDQLTPALASLWGVDQSHFVQRINNLAGMRG